MEYEKLSQIVENIKASPLYYMFISSRELFHSNFWMWLSTINKNETLKLFCPEISSAVLNFEREKRFNKVKVDLCISVDNDEKIIIENKIKDFAGKEQMNRIIKAVGEDKGNIFLLVTLFWDNKLKERLSEKFKVLTYLELSERINYGVFSNSDYHKYLIEDYKKFINNLGRLAESLPITDKYDFFIESKGELFNILNGIKLWEAYIKFRASLLISDFNKAIQPNKNIEAGYSLHNKKATIDFWKNYKGYRVGIQLEGNQYRKFLHGENMTNIEKELLSIGFFDKEYRSPRGKTFLKYGKDFIYQYINVDDIKKDLFDNIVDDLSIFN